MSALGGVYNFNGAPVEAAFLDRLASGLKSRGPDGCRSHASHSIGLVYRPFHTTRKSGSERQPSIASNGVAVCWDGRLDNRQELLEQLSEDLLGDSTDVGLVLAAYLKWGADCLPKLIGDYAIAIWDPSIRTLFLARDPFGSRPLYYQSTGGRLVWSSLLEALLDLPGASLRVSDEYVADYFAIWHDPALTPYEGISMVEPGHVVKVANGHIESHTHWKPDTATEVRYASDEEYEDHFRHLFREGVRCRLRTNGPVWADLSGGLDSSSIVCMADQILAEGTAEATDLRTASYVEETAKSFEDGEFIPLMEQWRNRKGYHLRLSDYWLVFPEPEEKAIAAPSIALCNPGQHSALCREMRRCGARVLLSGLGGDQVLWNMRDPSPLLADLAWRWQLQELHGQIGIWSPILKETYPRVLWRNVLLPLLPRRIRGACLLGEIVPPWLNPGFTRRMRIKERSVPAADPYGFALPSQRMQSGMLLFIASFLSACSAAQSDQIDITYPFLHRPLVEFLTAIPFEQKLRPGETRSIQRRALSGLVPERVLRRKSKGGIGEFMLRGFLREGPRLKSLVTDALVCARGYVDGVRLQEELGKALHGFTGHLGMLVMTISLEMWLRSLEYGVVNAPLDYEHARRRFSVSFSSPLRGIGVGS
jgi:asparagine synthase (glutamine-hydrolysing)